MYRKRPSRTQELCEVDVLAQDELPELAIEIRIP
jgi:hypothetical protein